MATAALIGGGILLGGIASGIGSSIQAGGQRDAAEIKAESAANVLAASQAQQGIENERAATTFDQSQLAVNAQLGLLGIGGDPNAAQNLINSPLQQAINAQNKTNVGAMAAASGGSGGNLLAALQDRNQASLMQNAFGGLGQISGSQQQGALGFGGLAQGALGMANQAEFAQGDALGNAAMAQSTQNSIPFLAGANILNQGAQLGTFAATGGFGGGGGAPAAAPVGGGSNRLNGTTTGFML